jgi:enoyl-CoA hydratase/carnithine racemase
MADYQFCKVEDEGWVRIVTINRPEVLNALHSEAHWEFDGIWTSSRPTRSSGSAIITGEGPRAFSAGNDLKVQAAGRRGPRPATGFAGLSHRFDLDKPLIAAVNGVAMGGGFETALACDIIVAAENAVFALPEPRVGLIAGSGVHRLPRMIRPKNALGMILTGRVCPPPKARNWGSSTWWCRKARRSMRRGTGRRRSSDVRRWRSARRSNRSTRASTSRPCSRQ